MNRARAPGLRSSFGIMLFATVVPVPVICSHESGRITTHYSAAELSNLIAAVDSVLSSFTFGGDWFPNSWTACQTSRCQHKVTLTEYRASNNSHIFFIQNTTG